MLTRTKQAMAKFGVAMLQKASEEDEPTSRIVNSIRKELQQDENFCFICGAFQRKFGLGQNVFASPVIDPETFTITSWVLEIDYKPYLEFKGLDGIRTYLTECILAKSKATSNIQEELSAFLKSR